MVGLSEAALSEQNRQQRKEHLEMNLERDQGPVHVRLISRLWWAM